VNILGDDSIGRCEKKFRMNMCLILNGYWDRAVGIDKYKSIVNGNKERGIIFNFIINILMYK